MPDIPLATYRLQFSKDFTFEAGEGVVSYLKSLGVSHLYASPVLESAAGSTHGYDVQDFAKVSDERGGEGALKSLGRALEAAGLAMLLDIVPNHMAANPDNPYWRDVLAHGRRSQYWTLFDMRVPDGDQVHLPVLAQDIRTLFDGGNLRIDSAAGVLRYFDTNYPLAPGTPPCPATADFATFEKALAAQNYMLTPWTETKERVSYRRFFDVTSLIGVRIEDEKNYALAHAKLFSLLQEMPSIRALRCDHIDGLAAPQAYLERLAKHGLPVWVEKILGRDEAMVPEWPVEGTTGYEFIDRLNQLFVDPEGFHAIETAWLADVDNAWPNFEACVTAGKTLVRQTLFASEMGRLGALSGGDNPAACVQAEAFWSAMAIALPVYRTYLGEGEVSAANKRTVNATAADAKTEHAEFSDAASQFVGGVLAPDGDRQRQAVIEWQQLSGPIMAKGLEDCSHYRYTPLMALNEVGCPASLRDGSTGAFFTWLSDLTENFPNTLKATSTHDTKRSEDTRARLYALADKSKAWIDFWRKASAINAPHRRNNAPSRPAEYILYQAIVSTWPLDDRIDEAYIKRVDAYMEKALHEARRETSWLLPDKAYEQGVHDFVTAIFADRKFLDLAATFCRPLAAAGAVNALAVQTLKLLTPGVPDLYQGSECWDFSLVDPDNRRPVDFGAHAALAVELDGIEARDGRAALLTRLTRDWRDGGIKQWLTRQLLAARRLAGPAAMATPCRVSGALEGSLVVWRYGGFLVAVPRRAGQFAFGDNLEISADAWQDTRIDDIDAGENFTDLLTGKRLDGGAAANPAILFADFPVAVLQLRSSD